MEQQHREDDNAGLAWWQPQAQQDDHYANFEHRPQRMRLRSPSLDPFMPLSTRFAGDGLDYRRPVMTSQGTGGQEGPVGQQMGYEAARAELQAVQQRASIWEHLERTGEQPAAASETIDLTGDGDAEEASLAEPSRADNAGTSRAQRLPRFERNIIDIDSSDNDEPAPRTRDWAQPPIPLEGADESLFMPQQSPQRSFPQNFAPLGPRRTHSDLRRPGFMRQSSPATHLDDVEIVGSRPTSRVHSRRQTPTIMPPRSMTPFPGENSNAAIDLTGDDDDDVVFTQSRSVSGINGDRPAMAGTGVGTREDPEIYAGPGIGRLAQIMRDAGRRLPAFANNFADWQDSEAARRAQADARLAQARQHRREAEDRVQQLRDRVRFQPRAVEGLMQRDAIRPVVRRHVTALPGMMLDFGTAAFDLGYGIPRPSTPKYEPPAPVEKGFTRNPEEDEVVVCPNCGDELAMGDSELKQQVWVVKQCGHVSLLTSQRCALAFANTSVRHTVAIAPKFPWKLSLRAKAKARVRCPSTCPFRCLSRNV